MDDEMVDLRDERKRLTRLGIAAVIAVGLTIVTMMWIDSVSDAPGADPVGASTRPLLAIAIFVVSTAWVTVLIARLQRRS